MKGCSRKSSDVACGGRQTPWDRSLNERLLPKEQRLDFDHGEAVGDPLPSMKGCSRKSSDASLPLGVRTQDLPLNERLLPKEQRRCGAESAVADFFPQ